MLLFLHQLRLNELKLIPCTGLQFWDSVTESCVTYTDSVPVDEIDCDSKVTSENLHDSSTEQELVAHSCLVCTLFIIKLQVHGLFVFLVIYLFLVITKSPRFSPEGRIFGAFSHTDLAINCPPFHSCMLYGAAGGLIIL